MQSGEERRDCYIKRTSTVYHSFPFIFLIQTRILRDYYSLWRRTASVTRIDNVVYDTNTFPRTFDRVPAETCKTSEDKPHRHILLRYIFGPNYARRRYRDDSGRHDVSRAIRVKYSDCGTGNLESYSPGIWYPASSCPIFLSGHAWARAQPDRGRMWWITGRLRSGRQLRIYWISNREPRVFRIVRRTRRLHTGCTEPRVWYPDGSPSVSD